MRLKGVSKTSLLSVQLYPLHPTRRHIHPQNVNISRKTWMPQTTHQFYNKFVSMEYCSEASLGEGILLRQDAQIGGSVGHGSQPDDENQRK